MKDAIKSIKEILSSHHSILGSVADARKGQAERVIRATAAVPDLTLSSLGIPNDVMEEVVASITGISRFKLVMILLRYSKGLTYKNIMSLSKELGKPIIYGWLDTEFQRKEYRQFIKSEQILGSQEKLYSLTEPGKKKVESIMEEIRGGKDD